MYNPYFATCAAYPVEYDNDYFDDDYAGYGFGYGVPLGYTAVPAAVLSPTVVPCDVGYNSYRSLYAPGAYGGWGNYGWGNYYDDDDLCDDDSDFEDGGYYPYYPNTLSAGFPFRRRSL